MKIFTIILISFISIPNLNGQILELNGIWKTLIGPYGGRQKVIVFNNDSLLISEYTNTSTDVYNGTFKIEKDTLIHFVDKHFPFYKVKVSGPSPSTYISSPFINKYTFWMEGGFIFLEEFHTTQKGRKRLILKEIEKEIKKQLVRTDIRPKVRMIYKKKLEALYLTVVKKESNSIKMNLISIFNL